MREEASCPVCNADVPMDGNERKGDAVYCAYCKAPLKVAKVETDDEDLELEEDF